MKVLSRALFLLLFPAFAFGQGTAYSNHVWTAATNVPSGAQAPLLSVPKAKVSVCTAGASPCDYPQLYVDLAETQKQANPLTTDSRGNFSFFTASGNYYIIVASQTGAPIGTFPIALPATVIPGDVAQNPTVSQFVNQPSGTSFGTNYFLEQTRTVSFGKNAQCNNWGDSFTAGYYSTPVDGTGNVYSTFGYAGLIDRYMGWTCVNDGASGSQAMDATQNDAIISTTVTQGSISTMMPGTNDFHSTFCAGCTPGMSTPLAQDQYFKQALSNAAWMAIPSTAQKATAQNCPTSGPLNCTFAGDWTNIAATGARGTPTNGDTVTVHFSGTSLYISSIEQFGNGSTYGITVDGVAVARNGTTTLATGGQITRTFNDPARGYSTYLIRVANLNSGPHTAIFTCINANTNNPCDVVWFGSNENAAQRIGPYVFIGTTPRAQAAGYAAFGGSDAIVTQFVAMDKEIAAELASDGLNVQSVDTTSALNPLSIPNPYYTDGFHPALLGHQQLAQAFEDGITGALLPNDRGVDQILQGVNICSLGGSWVIGGCPPSLVRGQIGSATGFATGAVSLGTDGGGLYRTSANTLLIKGGPSGFNNLQVGGTTNLFPMFHFGANEIDAQDATGGDTIKFHSQRVDAGASGYFSFNGTPGFTGSKVAGSCVLNIQGGIITSITGC